MTQGRRQAIFPRALLLWAATVVPVFAEVADEEILLPEPPGVTARNAFFEVTADDMLSAQFVAMTGELFATRFSRILPRPSGAGIIHPVRIDLFPVGEDESPAAFQTRIQPSGEVNVSVAWSDRTTRAWMERGVVQGYLTYLSGAYSAGTITVPLWLELAGQHLARAQAIPAHGHSLARRVVEKGPMRLETILNAQRGEGIDEELAAQAYWLLLFLEREGRGQGRVRNFLIRILRGEEPMVSLAATFGDQLRSTADAQAWWLVGVNELLRAPGSPMPPARESRARVVELSGFVFTTRDGTIRLFPDDLWQYRASARLQDELQFRIRVLRVETAATHPYYHNVLLSLERLFQSVLDADEEEYRRAVLAVRHDLRTGDELLEDTASMLDDLEKELAR